MATAEEESAKRQPRRARREVHDLVMAAAEELFTARGYHGTKTRQIAERAGVGESVIFRNFGSKADLFEQVVLEPFVNAIESWALSVRNTPPDSATAEDITRSFVTGLYDVTESYRELLLTLLAARVGGGDASLAAVATRFGDNLARSLGVVREVLLEQMHTRDMRGLDVPTSAAVSVGAILSLVLFGDWLFSPYSDEPDKQRQITELTQMLQHGVRHRAD